MTDSLLAHLSWKLSSHHEDIAVEALGYILKSESARRAATDLLEKHGAKVASIERFKTQVTQKDGSRPDLVGLDRNNKLSVLIEAKFWAGLTENQPNAYLERLPQKGILLFVAPTQRIESLWAELRKLAKVTQPRPDDEETEFKHVMASKRHLMLTSWTHLLDCLETAGDSHLRSGIQELRGLADRLDQDAFLPIRPDEFAPEIPRRLLNLNTLVNDAVTRAEDEGWMNEGSRAAAQSTGYGKYVSIAEARAGAWFGIDFPRWARADYPDTPLWLCFGEWEGALAIGALRQALEDLFQSDPPGCFDEGGWLYVPIMLPTAVEYPSVLKAVVARIEYIANQISKGKPTL